MHAGRQPWREEPSTTASPPGQSPLNLLRAGALEHVRQPGWAGADVTFFPGSLDSFVFTDQMLKRLISQRKESRTQRPPLKMWTKQGITVTSVGFISQEDLC